MWSAHLPLARYKDTFADDKPSAGGSSLAVILLHDIGRDCSDGTVTGEGRHEDAVANGDGAEFEWVEEACNGRHFCSVCVGFEWISRRCWLFK